MVVTRRRSPLSAVRVAATAALIGTLGLTMFASSAGGATDPAANPTTNLHYAINRPLCQESVAPGIMRCFSFKRVPVKKGTKHAYSYRTNASRGPAGGYTPQALATAYDFDPKINRSNLTVAIVLWHDAPNVLSDLNTFNARYGLKQETAATFRKVNERGASSPLPARDPGAAGEIALDTQAVRGACNTCKILLVEADDPYDTDLAAAVNTAVRLGANIISNSYGTPELKSSSAITNAFNHPGVVLTVSTGDDGWFGWDYGNTQGDRGDGVASFPSSSPYVVAVGATTLTLDSANQRVSETVWNGNGPHDSIGMARQQPMGASGGGCSTQYPARPYQSHQPGYGDARCGGTRLAADMSLVGDPQTGFDVFDSYGSGGWVTIGGSSLSAPLAAGMFALAGGAQGARYPSSALYGNSQTYPSTRFDVTSGGNGFCGSDSPADCAAAIYQPAAQYAPTKNPNRLNMNMVDCSFGPGPSEYVPQSRNRACNAAAGFDGPSGVGTPHGLGLFKRTDPIMRITHPSTTNYGRSTTFVASGSERLPHTYLSTLSWNWGDGRTSTVPSRTGKTVTHAYARKGTFTVTLTVYDTRYQSTVTQTRITVR
ncbi:MAG: PKD domain-containing protein [Jatrophihabitans sp.]